MGTKKMGRPTDNPKDISLKVRLDKETSEKLDDCIQELEVSKAEVIRRGALRYMTTAKIHFILNYLSYGK